MRIELEVTKTTDDFLTDIYKYNCKIADILMGPNNYLCFYIEGSEVNLMKFYFEHYCDESTAQDAKDFYNYVIEKKQRWNT